MPAKTKTYDFGYTGDWGGYANVDMAGTLTCTLSADLSTVECAVKMTKTEFSAGQLTGSGSYNALGVMFNPPAWLADASAYRAGAAITYDDLPETYDRYVSDVTAAIPNAFTDAVWGFYADDTNRGSGTFGTKRSCTYDVSGSVFDKLVLGTWQRWFDYQGTTSSELRHIVSPAGIIEVRFTDIFPELAEYYPGARRASGKWLTQDASARGDYLRASGKWADAKNREGEAYSGDRGYRRSSGKWVKMPKQ